MPLATIAGSIRLHTLAGRAEVATLSLPRFRLGRSLGATSTSAAAEGGFRGVSWASEGRRAAASGRTAASPAIARENLGPGFRPRCASAVTRANYSRATAEEPAGESGARGPDSAPGPDSAALDARKRRP